MCPWSYYQPSIPTLMLLTRDDFTDMVMRQAQALVQVLQQSSTKSMSPAELATNLKQLGGILTQLLEYYREKLPEWTSLDQLPKVWLLSTLVVSSSGVVLIHIVTQTLFSISGPSSCSVFC